MKIAQRLLMLSALVLFLTVPRPAAAFSMSPISQVLTPSGSGSSCAYVVENTGTEPIAIEFFVAHLDKQLDGSEDLSRREEENFAVFPPQVVLPVGASRTVRVRWLGVPDPEHELAYRFMAEQIPVQIDDPAAAPDGEVQARLRFHYKYHGTLFVRPRRAKPDIDLAEVELVAQDAGPLLRVRLHNAGDMRGWVRRFELELAVEGQRYALTEADLPALEDLPVLARGSREIVVPWPAQVPAAQPAAAAFRLSD